MSVKALPEHLWGVVPRAALLASGHLLSWHLLIGAATGKGPAYSRRVTERAAELHFRAAMPLKDAVVHAMGDSTPPAEKAAA
jgi:hypothetical protein